MGSKWVCSRCGYDNTLLSSTEAQNLLDNILCNMSEKHHKAMDKIIKRFEGLTQSSSWVQKYFCFYRIFVIAEVPHENALIIMLNLMDRQNFRWGAKSAKKPWLYLAASVINERRLTKNESIYPIQIVGRAGSSG